VKSSLLIRGGTVVDGSGSAAYRADVLVEEDTISAVSPDLAVGSDTRVIQAAGKIVCPGFIDLHSHADFTLLAFPGADSALRQGITTVAVGNCGGGVAPASDRWDVREVAFAFSSEWGVPLDWSTFGEYTRRLDGAAINVAPLVAHGAIRSAAMGLAQRAASPAEVEVMEDLLRSSLAEGAFGMSTGLQYLPGSWASRDEIRSLVSIVGETGRTYATHMRNRADQFADATIEAITTAEHTGAHLQLSHFAPRPYAPPEQVDAAFAAVAEAVAGGQAIGIDTFPEIWGPALLVDLFPAEVMKGSLEEVLDRLGEESVLTSIDKHFESKVSFLARIAGYGEIYLSGMPKPDDRIGLSLGELADRTRRSVGRLSSALLREAAELYRTVGIRHIYATESDLRRTLELPYCSVESDGIVTTGEGSECSLSWNASTYGYTARVLEHYVRGEGFLTLEDAIRKMTALPAQALKLRSRGTLQPGNYADVVVLDLDTIEDRTTPDDMARYPAGIELVLVNGKVAYQGPGDTGFRHGRLLAP